MMHLKLKVRENFLFLTLFASKNLHQLIFCKCFIGLNSYQLSFLGRFWCMVLDREWKDLFLKLSKGVFEGKEFPTSEGKQLRDFCFIDDFVLSVFSSIDNTKAFGEVINIASGKPISIKNVVN